MPKLNEADRHSCRVAKHLDEHYKIFPELANLLALQYGGVWGEHPDYPEADWRDEVGNEDTRLGYWSWVAQRVDGLYRKEEP